MKRNISPLRYPGGKANIFPLVSDIITINGLDKCCYAEPFAGGCGLALSLLIEDYVSEIMINDIDYSIWAFWDAVLNNSDALIEKIMQTKVDLENWYKQVEIQKNYEEYSNLEIAFSTFFLNRTNRSGIIKKAGPIGGISQTGNYKIDCRFNKIELSERIKRISKYKDRIYLSNLDALDFIANSTNQDNNTILFCIDPPYFAKGEGLYTNFYKNEDHANLADFIKKIQSKWIVTYDNVPEISELYKDFRQSNLYINYSLQKKRVGSELLIYSDGIELPKYTNDEAA